MGDFGKDESSNSLKEEWTEKEVKYRRSPYGMIILYQFCLPIFVLMLIDYGVIYYHINYAIPLFVHVLLYPIIFLINYYGYRLFVVLLSILLIRHYEKVCPSKEGTFERKFSEDGVGMASKDLRYYHLRGFVHKYPMFITKKSMFPWMLNFSLRHVGMNKLSKNALYGDAFVGLEMTEIDDGVVIMDANTVSGHVVDSVFGNVSIITVKIGKNAVIHPMCGLAPGTHINDGITVGPRTFTLKNWRMKDPKAKLVWGAPAKQTQPKGFLSNVPNNENTNKK